VTSLDGNSSEAPTQASSPPSFSPRVLHGQAIVILALFFMYWSSVEREKLMERNLAQLNDLLHAQMKIQGANPE
jgi:hypothetical protein